MPGVLTAAEQTQEAEASGPKAMRVCQAPEEAEQCPKSVPAAASRDSLSPVTRTPSPLANGKDTTSDSGKGTLWLVSYQAACYLVKCKKDGIGWLFSN